jgi:hypothetical protein
VRFLACRLRLAEYPHVRDQIVDSRLVEAASKRAYVPFALFNLLVDVDGK